MTLIVINVDIPKETDAHLRGIDLEVLTRHFYAYTIDLLYSFFRGGEMYYSYSSFCSLKTHVIACIHGNSCCCVLL